MYRQEGKMKVPPWLHWKNMGIAADPEKLLLNANQAHMGWRNHPQQSAAQCQRAQAHSPAPYQSV